MAEVKIKVCDGCLDPEQKGLQVRRVGDNKTLETVLLCAGCRAPIDALRKRKSSTRGRARVLTWEELEAAKAEQRSATRTPAQRRADRTRGTRKLDPVGAAE